MARRDGAPDEAVPDLPGARQGAGPEPPPLVRSFGRVQVHLFAGRRGAEAFGFLVAPRRTARHLSVVPSPHVGDARGGGPARMEALAWASSLGFTPAPGQELRQGAGPESEETYDVYLLVKEDA